MNPTDTLTKTETLEFTMFCMAKFQAHTFAEMQEGLLIIVNSAFEEWDYLRHTKAGIQLKKEQGEGKVSRRTQKRFKKEIVNYQIRRNKQAQELLDKYAKNDKTTD